MKSYTAAYQKFKMSVIKCWLKVGPASATLGQRGPTLTHHWIHASCFAGKFKMAATQLEAGGAHFSRAARDARDMKQDTVPGCLSTRVRFQV